MLKSQHHPQTGILHTDFNSQRKLVAMVEAAGEFDVVDAGSVIEATFPVQRSRAAPWLAPGPIAARQPAPAAVTAWR